MRKLHGPTTKRFLCREVRPVGGGAFKLRNVDKGEYLYVGSSSLDSNRRLALTWVGGGDIEGDAGLWRIPGLAA
jgi:hypothetical protein